MGRLSQNLCIRCARKIPVVERVSYVFEERIVTLPSHFFTLKLQRETVLSPPQRLEVKGGEFIRGMSVDGPSAHEGSHAEQDFKAAGRSPS